MENSCSLNLAQKKCIPCSGGVPALQGEELRKLAAELPAWKVIREHHIEREYAFPDFKAALDFVVRVGALAEEEGHHPDLELSWGRVGVRIFTHKIDGLTESDFILGAKIERLHAAGWQPGREPAAVE